MANIQTTVEIKCTLHNIILNAHEQRGGNCLRELIIKMNTVPKRQLRRVSIH